MDLLQYIKSKRRRYRIITMGITDGNCKRINTCLSCVNDRIIRICAADTVVTASILTSAHKSQLSLNCSAVFTCFLHNGLYSGDVFLKRKRRSIQHNRCKAKLQSLVNRPKSKTMIQMDSHIHLSLLCSLYHHRSHQVKRRIFQTHLRDLKDDRSIQFFCCTDRTSYHFHITNTESTAANIFLFGTSQQIFHFHKCHDSALLSCLSYTVCIFLQKKAVSKHYWLIPLFLCKADIFIPLNCTSACTYFPVVIISLSSQQ